MYRKRMIWIRLWVTALVVLVSLTLIAATLAEPLLDEPWNTLLLAVLFPVIINGYKIYKDRGGKKPTKRFLQVTSLVIAGVFVYANGGFALYVWPAFPVFGEDIAIFLGDVFTFGRELTVVVWLAYGSMMALYEFVLKRCFETVGFAAANKVESRKIIGFFA